MNIHEAKQVLLGTHAAALRRGERASGMHLESGPGVGKSDGTAQYAAELAKRTGEPVGLVTFMLATISSVDVRGFMLPSKGTDGVVGSTFSTPPWMPNKGNTQVFTPDGGYHPEGTWNEALPTTGVLFLDEFSQADEEVKKPAAELIYRGAVGTAHLPSLWRVVSAGNRVTDRSGVVRELMFIVNRRCRLMIEANLPVWLEWANALEPQHRPHYLSISFAQKNPDIVFKDAVPAGTDPFCTPRTLCLLDKDMRALRSDQDEKFDKMPTHDLARSVAAGWIGDGSAAQFFTHLKYADELPDISDIEKDPKGAKLPPNKDAQMVCGYMLAHNINEQNATPMMAYINRLNIEMQVLAVRAIGAQADRAKHLMSTGAYVNWLTKHKDLLMASRS